MNIDKQAVGSTLQLMIDLCHQASYQRGWWRDQRSGQPLLVEEGLPPHLEPYVKCTKLLLGVSETAECMEGLRRDATDDKLPQFSMETVEIVDHIIRLFDYAGAYKLPVVEAFFAKVDVNATREDHNIEHRVKPGGKKF
jgi:hypothetical protein